MQTLRVERSSPALLAAVQMLPNSSPLVWKLLDLLGTGTADDDTRLRPTYRVAAALLDRAKKDELGAQVDNVVQRLRDAGLQMHYSLWLRWAGCHVATGSVQGVRRVMRLLEEAEGPAALTAHFYVFLTKVGHGWPGTTSKCCTCLLPGMSAGLHPSHSVCTLSTRRRHTAIAGAGKRRSSCRRRCVSEGCRPVSTCTEP